MRDWAASNAGHETDTSSNARKVLEMKNRLLRRLLCATPQ